MNKEEGTFHKVDIASYAVEAARQYRRENEETLTEQKAAENDGTAVTIVCITYNHENFIAQALDSFVMQKTNFKYKIFVGEDCGTDGTAAIVRDYAQRYPGKIVAFIREKNMGAQRNLIDLCQRANSPYIAFCEGDDYWVDEYKLQKQFDYMERHRELRACCTQTEILAPEDWHLRSWYHPIMGGKIILPDSAPGYHKSETFSAEEILNTNVPHTSTYFYRWNYDMEIPDWYYRGFIGDAPLLLMQLGNTRIGYIPQITSVYRINEGSVFFNKDRETHFLNTRKDMIRWLCGFRDYALINFESYPITFIENRIKLETANYLSILIKREDDESITNFFVEYPEAVRISLNAYLSFYWDQRSLTASFGWSGYQMAVRNRYFRRLMYPQVKFMLAMKKAYNVMKRAYQKLKQTKGLFLYWKNTFKKKNCNLWVFSGFNQTNYMDNTKYLYEYVLDNHPEIKAIWITKDQDIFQKLTGEGKPVLMAGTAQCRRIVSRAAIAVTDHFKMSDYDAFSGLNDRTKIVQLWHGVGLKAMGNLQNTTVSGVKFSDDILPNERDTAMQKRLKKVKYLRYAFHRELFEKYFILVCPGWERIKQIADPWHIPRQNCFLCGHPRNIHLHSAKAHNGTMNVLYAPTYRWHDWGEKRLVKQLADNGQMIQERMEYLNGELMVRLHPHTWRNHSALLDAIAEKYNRIKIDHEKDIYTTLADYDILISDYSSIVYDFVLLDRPMVFFNYDFEEFIKLECGLNYDYEAYSPGIKAITWAEVLMAVEQYAKDPHKDSEWRCRVRDEFYDMSVNDENNSERLVQEIKRRLSIQ